MDYTVFTSLFGAVLAVTIAAFVLVIADLTGLVELRTEQPNLEKPMRGQDEL